MSHNDEYNEWGSFIMGFLLIWGGVQAWSYVFPDTQKDSYQNSSYSTKHKQDCIEPRNPYYQGSGHYAGFEWGENGKTCGGNSGSFVGGCEEYEAQEEAYISCLRN